MKKFLSFLFKAFIVVAIILLAITVFIISVNSQKVPDLYAYTDTRTSKGFTANYTWNAFNGVLKEEDISKEKYVFKTENTLLVTPNERITISNHQTSMTKRHNFYLEQIKYEDSDGLQTTLDYEKPSNSYADSNYAEFEAPEKEDTYIYYFNINYYEKGTVEYGLKVIVSSDAMYNVEDLSKYKNTSIYDIESIDSIIKLLPYSRYRNNLTIRGVPESPKLIISYSTIELDRENFTKNVVALFALIPEAEIIEYKTKDLSYIYTRRELELKYGRHLSDYANDVDLWNSEVFYGEKRFDEASTVHTLLSRIILNSLNIDSGDKFGSVTVDTGTFNEYIGHEVDDLTKELVIRELSLQITTVFDMSYDSYTQLNHKQPYVCFESILKYLPSGDTIVEVLDASGEKIDSVEEESGDNPLTLHNNEIYVLVRKNGKEEHYVYTCNYVNGEWTFYKENIDN